MKRSSFLLIVFVLVASCGCGTVNRPITVADNTTMDRSLYSVNGCIRVGRTCTVNGGVQTVNGAVTIEAGSSVDGTVASINGAVRLARDVTVNSNLKSINGAINTDRGCTINGQVASINGAIQLTGTHVRKDVTTFTGRITLTDHSQVDGNIRVRKADSVYRQSRLLILIERDSVVHGDIINENPHVSVEVRLREGGRIDGELKNVSPDRL